MNEHIYKQIELTGFKSFMDRTVLELPPGITGIVGADLSRSGLFKLIDPAGVSPRQFRQAVRRDCKILQDRRAGLL